jgi:hypothetical protein
MFIKTFLQNIYREYFRLKDVNHVNMILVIYLINHSNPQ